MLLYVRGNNCSTAIAPAPRIGGVGLKMKEQLSDWCIANYSTTSHI